MSTLSDSRTAWCLTRRHEAILRQDAIDSARLSEQCGLRSARGSEVKATCPTNKEQQANGAKSRQGTP